MTYIKKLNEFLEILSDHPDVLIENIPSRGLLRESYDAISNVYPEKVNLSDMILRLHRPMNLEPGTIGSFLFGCLQGTYGDVSAECSPLYHYGVEKEHDILCDHQVWLQKSKIGNSRFTRIINPSHTGNAMIFTMGNFDNFTSNEINDLIKHGVNNVQIFNTKRSKHHLISRSAPISDLPTKLYIDSEQYLDRSKNNTGNNKLGAEFYQMVTDNTNAVIFVLIAIIFIVIIGMGIWNYLYPNHPNSKIILAPKSPI